MSEADNTCPGRNLLSAFGVNNNYTARRFLTDSR